MSDKENSEEEEAEAQPVYPSSGPGREDMVADYLPPQEDWEAKSILDTSDPAAVAALNELGTMYPEVNDLQPLVDEFMVHFLKSRTSVGGKSRDEYRNILVSMFGGNIDEDTARSAFVDAFAGEVTED